LGGFCTNERLLFFSSFLFSFSFLFLLQLQYVHKGSDYFFFFLFFFPFFFSPVSVGADGVLVFSV